MSATADAAGAERVDRMYREKARVEVASAEALAGGDAVRGQGDLLAEVLLVKGSPGPGDTEAGRALAGADGVAIGKALDALDFSKARYAFCTRVGNLADSERDQRVRLIVEAIDPSVVVLLDGEAASDLASAYGVERPPFGEIAGIAGRTVLAVEDFEASLADEKRKARAWRQLRALGGKDTVGE